MRKLHFPKRPWDSFDLLSCLSRREKKKNGEQLPLSEPARIKCVNTILPQTEHAIFFLMHQIDLNKMVFLIKVNTFSDLSVCSFTAVLVRRLWVAQLGADELHIVTSKVLLSGAWKYDLGDHAQSGKCTYFSHHAH